MLEKEIIETVKLVQAQISIVNDLWAYYSAVTLGVIGFIISRKNADNLTKEEVIAFILGYSLFAIGNMIALTKGQSTLHYLANINDQTPENIIVFDVFSKNTTLTFQLIMYFSAIGVIAFTSKQVFKKSK
ncbi:hypothetical protein [Curvivirga sp.]|uniref:hypothetical protein n=1 Tax=Curvivirga sp. TaxID=2856848 RepID=UPI003B59443C